MGGKTRRRLNFAGAHGGMCLNAAVGYVNECAQVERRFEIYAGSL
jgi:hypothetical protein